MRTPDTFGWGPACKTPVVTLRRGDGLAIGLHPAIAPLVAMLIDLTELMGYDVRPGETWGYNCRNVAGTRQRSVHAWGLAIDINAPSNGRGVRGDIPDDVVSLWTGHGFGWGGDWAYTDPMHFEFERSPTSAAEITNRLRNYLGGHKVEHKETTMRMIIDKRDGTVWLFGAGDPKSLGGRPDVYERLLALGIPSTEDDGLLVDFLRS